MFDFKQMALEVSEDYIKWRHEIHKNPELSFEEEETTKKIVSILKDIGYEEIRVGVPYFPNTGVFAELNPGKEGKCVALRADIDALPIKEEADVSYTSENDGVMHACGHDAHTAMLLGAAKVLYSIKDEIPGNVKLIFQPAEESAKPEIVDKSGANLINSETDELDNVDAIFGLHVANDFPTGKIGYRPSEFMTANALVDLVVEGVGGHGAMPHYAVDPVVISAQIINVWQTIISREINPLHMGVLTVGKLIGDGDWNIIPSKATLTAGVRTFDRELLKHLIERMEESATGVAESMRATVKFDYLLGSPPVINDEDLTHKSVGWISEAIGEENTEKIDPIMGTEDFAWYQQTVPGVFLFLGIEDEEKGTVYSPHHPKFKVDDDALSNGVASLTSIAYGFLTDNSK